MKGGALELASTETRFELNESRSPVKLLTKKDLAVHALVAEFMILANEYVARKIHSAYPTCGTLLPIQCVVCVSCACVRVSCVSCVHL